MLNGERITIKPFETEEEVIKYVTLYNNLEERTIEDHLETSNLDKVLTLFQKNQFLDEKKKNYMILNEEDILIGMIQWKKESDFEMTLGYRLYESKYRNKGYMTDAVTTFIKHIFTDYGDVNRLTLYIHEENTPSIKLANKLGFKFEGTMRDAYKYRGKTVGFSIYSLLRKEYQK